MRKKVRGRGPGVALTIWVSEQLKQQIEKSAGKKKLRPSRIAREILEDYYSITEVRE